MGLLDSIWKAIKGSEAVDMILLQDIDGSGPKPELVANSCYVQLYVQSLRLRNARRFTQKFDGVVYSYVTLPFQGAASVKVPAVSKPNNLIQVDPGAISKVITFDKLMMGAIPWRGGPMLLELGLFSVKGGDLLSPMLDFVTDISNTAGISFVGKILPFAPLISKGVGILAGQTKDVALEVGIDTTFDVGRPGTHAIIAEPKDDKLDRTKLSIDPTDGKLLYGNQPLNASYCVFSVRQTTQKADFGEIPELKDKFDAFLTTLRGGVEDRAKEALAAYRVAVLTSPDLITSDAAHLVADANELMKSVFAGGAVSLQASGVQLPTQLADVALYADR